MVNLFFWNEEWLLIFHWKTSIIIFCHRSSVAMMVQNFNRAQHHMSITVGILALLAEINLCKPILWMKVCQEHPWIYHSCKYIHQIRSAYIYMSSVCQISWFWIVVSIFHLMLKCCTSKVKDDIYMVSYSSLTRSQSPEGTLYSRGSL